MHPESTEEDDTVSLDLEKAVGRLASRERTTEQDIQSDIRAILLYGGLDLEADDLAEVTLEAQAGGGRRIDIEAGFTVIEVKKDDLAAKPDKKRAAVEQLRGYLGQRTSQTDQRYVGILTDGVSWFLYHRLPDGSLQEVSSLRLDADEPNVEQLVVWLEAVLATAHQITPTPTEVERRLGHRSPSFGLDLADLRALYAQCADDPSVQLKRELWARLLGAALGENFDDDDELFIRHTYLVASAELIAHAAVGFPLAAGTYDAHTLLSGELFREADISGVVEADFFDWPIEAAGGDRFVTTLARRLARFDWKSVDHDVLKVLYESVIDAETRKSLGEYYTPDWLAERVVEEVVESPLEQRVLDPACGSGTFLFWAVKKHLSTAANAGLPNREALESVTTHVYGVDLHPVAVTLARVTYLLAIGLDRLSADRGRVVVPVYLGDSVQWDEDQSLLSSTGLTVYTSDGAELFARELFFPERVVANAGVFDELVSELTRLATNRKAGSKPPAIDVVLSRFNVHPEDREAVEATFDVLCHLFDEGRNHIWGYYIRNRARPVWLAREGNRVDVLVGNPPWLSYRYMDKTMQGRFRKLSEARQLWAGAEVATHQDLSGLFVVRAMELYLRQGGRFGFVMPAAVLSRRQYQGFRTGLYTGGQAHFAAKFTEPWDLTAVEPTIFPVPASVVLGLKAEEATPMSLVASAWSAKLDSHHATWDAIADRFSQVEAVVSVAEDAPKSPYEKIFSQGATLVPRVLVTAEKAPPSPLGVPAGKVAIQSARSTQEKAPWKNLASLSATMSDRYVKTMLVGTSIAAFRVFDPGLAVVPWVGGELVDGSNPKIDTDPGLAAWWRAAEAAWEKNKSSGSKMTLTDRVNFQRTLRNQFPIPAHRVVYTKAGSNLVAARVSDPTAIIDHKLYWAPVGSPDEAWYLSAILNSATLQERVRPLQSVGQFGPRDFDKYVFAIPFPLFDRDNEDHQALAALGEQAEKLAAAIDIPEGSTYRKVRPLVDEALEKDGVSKEIEVAVTDLLDAAIASAALAVRAEQESK